MITYTIHAVGLPTQRWYEIEAIDTATGRVETVAVCDTRDEARDILSAIEGATGGPT